MICLLGEVIVINVFRRLVLQQNPEDRGTCGSIRRWNEEDAVETTGAPKGRVEVPRSVRRGEDQQAVVGTLNAIHFREELVDELTARALAKVGPARAEGVDL